MIKCTELRHFINTPLAFMKDFGNLIFNTYEMEKYSKDDLKEDLDILIQAWLQSDNENTTYLADSLATYAVQKLNGEIRESCKEICGVTGCDEPAYEFGRCLKHYCESEVV